MRTDNVLREAMGAVAVTDALGFKAARRRVGPGKLVESVQVTRGAAAHQARLHYISHGAITHVEAISDLIIIATLEKHNRDHQVETTMQTAVSVVAAACSALFDPVRTRLTLLAYRGCIAVGDLAMSADIFIGSSIDEAAEFSEQADAAVVWLTPSAREALEPVGDKMLVLEWTVPLKNRGGFDALVVNPFYQCVFEAVGKDGEPTLIHCMDLLESRLIDTFGSTPPVDVAYKLQQTAAFLREARHHTMKVFPEWKDAYLAEQAAKREGDGNA